MRVFLLEPTRHRVARTLNAEVETLFENAPSPFRTSEFFTKLDARLEDVDYDPSEDMIVVAGSLIAMSFMLGHLCKKYGRVRTLIFDASTSAYEERSVPTWNITAPTSNSKS
jgi:hypothetical protein